MSREEQLSADQEWTQNGAIVLRKSDGAMRFEAHDEDQAYNAVERHNAAMPAEREAGYEECRKLWKADSEQLRSQLAQYENLQDQGWFHPDIVNELRKQLAAAVAALAKLKNP